MWRGIYYLDSYNYSQSGESTYEAKELESEEMEDAFIEAYEIIAEEIISVYSKALKKDNSLGGVDNEIKALEFLNQALFNYEIYTVNRELMKINITDKEFDRKSELRDSILNKSRIKQKAEKLLKAGLYDFVATDAHNVNDLKKLKNLSLSKKLRIQWESIREFQLKLFS